MERLGKKIGVGEQEGRLESRDRVLSKGTSMCKGPKAGERVRVAQTGELNKGNLFGLEVGVVWTVTEFK